MVSLWHWSYNLWNGIEIKKCPMGFVHRDRCYLGAHDGPNLSVLEYFSTNSNLLFDFFQPMKSFHDRGLWSDWYLIRWKRADWLFIFRNIEKSRASIKSPLAGPHLHVFFTTAIVFSDSESMVDKRCWCAKILFFHHAFSLQIHFSLFPVPNRIHHWTWSVLQSP